jgi:tRNA U34 5-methylaminomethyl-2-thiouridine-forming methyltransferase MnmC
MTSSGCAAERPADSSAGGLRPQIGADGSFSLFSGRFGEGFHGPIGALQEAQMKFVRPAQLERFQAGQRLRVVDVGFGLGTNSAALLEAAQARELALQIWGLELDPEPLRQALASPAFRRQWQTGTLTLLEGLLEDGQAPAAQAPRQTSSTQVLWGDARQSVRSLLQSAAAGGPDLEGRCDLVLLDAFSPQRCPELWSLEFLGALAGLLRPDGRLLTYCCAAAVRRSLQVAGLTLASIQPPTPLTPATGPGQRPTPWSYGTAASPKALPAELTPMPGAGPAPLAPLSAMEIEHLATRAAEPYRDPSGRAGAAEILAARQRAQALSQAGSTSAWRRRWSLEGRTDQPA